MTTSAHAEDTSSGSAIRTRYVGTTISTQAGAGMEGFSIATAGGDVFSGIRLSRWFSVEGFFAYHFATHPSTEIGGGGMCLGSGTDRWHWQSFGTRAWFHLAHFPALDFSIAPMLALGVSVDQWKSIYSPGGFWGFCYYPPSVTAGWAFDVGLDFAIEVRPVRWLGVRAMFETSLDGGQAGRVHGFGAVAVSGWVGPVLRF